MGPAAGSTAPVTIFDVAAKAGVDPKTVTNVLAGRHKGVRRDAVARAARVRAVAAKLGYRPNAAARSVALGRFGAIGMVLSTHSSQSAVFADLLYGLHERLAEEGQNLVVSVIDDQRLTSDADLPRILGQSMVDGLLLNYTHATPPRMAEIIERHAIPAVWINAKRPRQAVHIDDHGAGHEATRRLLERGHQRLAFLDTTAAAERTHEVHYSHPDRAAGYARAMADAGLPQVVDRLAGWFQESAVQLACEYLRRPDRPTGVVCYCMTEAGLLASAARLLGLRLGVDVSVICCNEFQNAHGVPIDTMLLPERAVGRSAVDMLLKTVAQGLRDQPSVAVPMVYKPGESIGLPASG